MDKLREKVISILAKYISDAKCQVFHSHDDVFLADQIIPMVRRDTIDKINKALEPAKLHLCWITEGNNPEPIEYGLADESGDEIDIALLGEERNDR